MTCPLCGKDFDIEEARRWRTENGGRYECPSCGHVNIDEEVGGEEEEVRSSILDKWAWRLAKVGFPIEEKPGRLDKRRVECREMLDEMLREIESDPANPAS
jgi:rubredoxin